MPSKQSPDLLRWLRRCELCPNFCRVNRLAGETGRCRVAAQLVISSANLHFGEEEVLVGRGGSGTIFFTCCNLSCAFCQNYEISQLDCGRPASTAELVQLMLSLQERGAENINLVTPTHQAALIFDGLRRARNEGLQVPIVYNCGGYENPEFLRELDGLVDIYMPDFKYGTDEAGERYSGIRGYSQWCRRSLQEMHRQVGDLRVNERGVATRGLLVRHLVLPRRAAGSRQVMEFLAREISGDTVVNVMDQYRPAYRAAEYPELARRVYGEEVREVEAMADTLGLRRIRR